MATSEEGRVTVAGDSQDDATGKRRWSIEKQPVSAQTDVKFKTDMAGAPSAPSAFGRLPEEIIEQIMLAADPDCFASLALLNSKWRTVSQQAHLYVHHLAQCLSYTASRTGPAPAATSDNLPKLRQLFSREVKRNLFEAYLRPSKTVIKLISTSISSSSCPGGEGLQFSSSPLGHHMLAYSSSRIYVLDVSGREIAVKRELKIVRRPAATCIRDDGSLLAVLLSEMQVDIYDLTASPPRRTQSIILDHSPRAIALSPCGSVLAAAYEGGIEVSSLNPGALATERRAVKCDAVDTLSFSFDGTHILGTTVQSSSPNTAVLTAPYYDPGSQMSDDSGNISALWTTSILFPNTSRDCSHAILLQNGRVEDASWAFTYDRNFETFRAVRIDDLRNGTTYFTGPVPTPTSQAKLLPCTLPAASYHGELVSAGFRGKEIWLYGVPDDLDALADAAAAVAANGGGGGADGASPSNGLYRRNSGPSSLRSPSRNAQDSGENGRVPPWQVLCDNARNTFVTGSRIAELDGVSTVKWVAGFGNSSLRERLVVAARGVLPPKPMGEDDGVDFVDGGRVTLIDFDYGTADGTTVEVTVEVGTREPEVLEEEHRDLDTEVAIVRRRTVAQNRGARSAMMRAATTAGATTGAGLAALGGAAPASLQGAPPLPVKSEATEEDAEDPMVPRRMGLPSRHSDEAAAATQQEEEDVDSPDILEAQEALDAPYAHASPRSGTTLRRAATAAAVNRRLHAPTAAGGHVTYRRADGRAEHPHESDADNWVPPPPPYQKEDPHDLPVFLRHGVPPVTVTAVPDASSASQGAAPSAPRSTALPPLLPVARSQTVMPVRRNVPPPRSATQLGSRRESVPPPLPVPAVAGPLAGAGSQERQRPVSHQSNYVDGDNVYDVSPPESPSREQATASTRLPSGSSTNSATAVSVPAPAPPSSLQMPSQYANARPQAPLVRSPPSLAVQIPGPSFPGNSATTQPETSSPSAIRRISNSQTWPTQPKPTGNAAMLPTGYPYSAPPVNMTSNDALAQAYPPAPRPEQLASLHNHDNSRPPKRLSGGFQVQRAPAGGAEGHIPARWSYQQMPTPPQQAQPTPQLRQPQPQPQPQSPLQVQTQLFSPQPRRPAESSPAPPPDTPLIISTPKGVSGAFDPPGQTRVDGHAEPTIVAPVPRHPRGTSQAAVLRPAVDRLDTIYSVSSQHSQPGMSQQVPQQQQQQQMFPPLNAPGSAAPYQQQSPASQAFGSTTTISAATRQPSQSRRLQQQSRAERSAAKNIADAKRRGWTGRRKSKRRNNKQPQDFDAASSAAWTDVSYSSAGYAGAQQQHSMAGLPPGHYVGPNGVVMVNGVPAQQQRPLTKDKRCVVM